MRGNRSENTSIEQAICRSLWRLGLRGYRRNATWLPGRPDVVFTRYKLAIFVHGCFWHRCPHCARPLPKTNSSYWEWKFQRNQDRDARAWDELGALEWRVVQFWGCEILRAADQCALEVRALLHET